MARRKPTLRDLAAGGPREPSPDDRPASMPSRGLAPAPAGKPPAGRNDPCPCGSGKKWKRCCGRKPRTPDGGGA